MESMMPNVIGPVPSDKWEREVRRQLLKQLPANWIVICSVSWAMKSELGFVRDGEADFVVLAPELGLAVIEVKGSAAVRIGSDGNWYRRQFDRSGVGKEILIKESPPAQANRNMHTLVKVIRDELSSTNTGVFPGLFAFLVAYPNGIIEGKLDLYDPTTVVTKRSMHQLGGAIKKALLARGDKTLGKRFSIDIAKTSAEILTNQRFRVVSVDTPLVALEDEKYIDELTRQQFSALRGAFELPRVAITGPAGSGKTLLAIWKLAALIEEGKKAIFVCFNTALAKSLCEKHADLSHYIVSVDSLFWNMVSDKTGRTQDDFYSTVLPDRIMDMTHNLRTDEFYDAIIIDEGQDFGEGRIIALYHLLSESDATQWLYFADNNQDVYKQGTDEILGAEVIFRLYHNCRNTLLINDATNKVCNGEVMPMPGVPNGELPHVIFSRVEKMAQKAWLLINELSPDGGAVVLSPFKLENSCMKGQKNAHGLVLTEDIKKLNQPGFVFFSTIKAFKGLEARHVVLVHADKPDLSPSLAEEDLYVAFTRATARLDIVTANKEAVTWLSGLLETK
jgi:hypothetical protein